MCSFSRCLSNILFLLAHVHMKPTDTGEILVNSKSSLKMELGY